MAAELELDALAERDDRVAHLRAPTATEPVNEIALTCGCSTSGVPTAEPRPMTTLKTPGGSPPSSRQAARWRPVSGASWASFMTTVFP